MDTTSLAPIIQRFLSNLESDEVLKQHDQEHSRRSANAKKLFQSEYLSHIAKAELLDFLTNTDAYYGVRGRQLLWKRLFGESDEHLPAVRDALMNLSKRASIGFDPADIPNLLKPLPGIGLAFLSEILTLCFPDKYWIWNGPVRSFFASQQIEIKNELPHGKKGDAGEEYFVVGGHIEDLRRAISKQAGRNIDFLTTDLFIFWANRQGSFGEGDPWGQRIAQWNSESDSKRLAVRLEGEQKARQRLESSLGQFTEQDVHSFAKDLNSDWYKDAYHSDRFKPAFATPQINKLVGALDELNKWAVKIWNASDEELDTILDECWSTNAIFGGGIILPTAILYLKDPEQYNIWLINSSKGLQVVAGFLPGAVRTAKGYRSYNKAMNEFRSRYRVPPQLVDFVLWRISEQETVEPDGQFTGFVPDTFAFLHELQKNNSDEWMHANNNANQVRFREVLREPLRNLFDAVSPTIQQMDPGLETGIH